MPKHILTTDNLFYHTLVSGKMGRMMQVESVKTGGRRLQGITNVKRRGTERTNRYLEVDCVSEICSSVNRDKINRK